MNRILQRFRIRSALSSMLPEHVAVCATDRAFDAGILSNEEKTYLSSSTPHRYEEFVTGRLCALTALSELGCDLEVLGRNEDRTPKWPPGFAGSVTHCDGFCAAAVCSKTHSKALGIDAEENAPLPPGVLERIASPGEIENLAVLEDRAGPKRFHDRVLFSAKESIYKALFPLISIHIDFSEAQVSFSPQTNSFSAELSINIEEHIDSNTVHGSYHIGSRHTITSVYVPNGT